MEKSPHETESSSLHLGQRPLLAYFLEWDTLLFSIKMSLFVGTVLAIINHGQAILTGHLTTDRLIPLLITYLVPFSVSLYSQSQGKRQRDHLLARQAKK